MLGQSWVVLDGFIYMSVVRKLVGLERPHLMSARWSHVIYQMGSVSDTRMYPPIQGWVEFLAFLPFAT